MSSHQDPDADADADELEMLAEDDAQEVLDEAGGDGDGDGDDDVAMDSDGDGDGDDQEEEITLHNDSVAYFDGHKDSVFAIAQHPLRALLVATGGSEGDGADAPGMGYVLDIIAAADDDEKPVLPPSYAADPAAAAAAAQTRQLAPVFALSGHSDSVNALAFTLPAGEFLVSGGLDGRLRVFRGSSAGSGSGPPTFAFLAEAQETEEVNWIAPCPAPAYANTIALGASDGSVWVYAIDAADAAEPLRIVQSYFLHTGPCTAGAWTPDGQLLATVAEDSSLHVFDVWGAAAAQGLAADNGQTVVSLTEADARFVVEGGLYSVAVAPSGAFLACGGAGGAIRIVGLPRLGDGNTPQEKQQKQKGKKGGAGEQSAQAGAILAALQTQGDSVESLAFAPAPQTLLAAGSVDGSICVFDTSRSFSVRRHIRGAHDEYPIVKVEFVRGAPSSSSSSSSSAAGPAAARIAAVAGGQATAGAGGWLLTSCGMDGVVRRWDLRGGAAASAAGGLVKEWRGHRGEGEGGGVLGFVQSDNGDRVVTAGDDGLVLVFEA